MSGVEVARRESAINASADFNRALQEMVEDPRSATGTQCYAMGLFGDSLAMENFTASGLSSEEAGQLRNVAGRRHSSCAWTSCRGQLAGRTSGFGILR